MRKLTYEDFVNYVDYGGENVDYYDGIVVAMVVVVVVVRVTMLAVFMATTRNRAPSKTW